VRLERLNSFILAEPEKCVGCRTCEIACALAHMTVPPAVAGEVKTRLTPRLFVVAAEGVTVPVMCRHCEDAPCANVCTMSAISRADGRVVVNTERCVGCRLCLMACPFGAIEFTPINPDAEPIFSRVTNPSNKIAYRASKCDLCFDQPDGPACVNHCPEKALVKMSAADSNKDRRAEAAHGLMDGQNATWA